MFLFTLLFALCAFCSAEDLPSFVKKCKYGDVACIVDSTNDIIINHHHEMDKLKFRHFDPWRHGELVAEEKENRPIQLNMHLKDSLMYGMKGLRFNRAVGWGKDIKESKFEIYGHTNYFNFTGKYQIDGRILLLPIQGNGEYNMRMEDITFGFRLKGDEFVKNGKKHFKVKKIKVLLEPSGFYVELTHLFDGNEQLGQALIKVINENWRDSWNEIGPSLLENIESILKDALQDLFDAFPYEDLFLPEE